MQIAKAVAAFGLLVLQAWPSEAGNIRKSDYTLEAANATEEKSGSYVLKVQKHAASAVKSAARAVKHLSNAKKALEKTKAEAKVIRQTGNNITDVAENITYLYPTKPETSTLAPRAGAHKLHFSSSLVAAMLMTLGRCRS